MPRKPISFELDFMIKDIFPRFTVKQFDDVSFNIKPLNQGLDYDTTGMIGKIFVGVNDDMFMQTTGITVSSNNINVLLDKNMLQKNGRAYAEIELTDEVGTITSSSFIFDIDPKIGEGGMIPGEYEGFVEKYERLISEFKNQINSSINNSNDLIDKTIKNCYTSVDNKLNTVNDRFNAKVSEVDSKLNSVDSLINAKVSDFEKRFNTLTSSKQQDAEIIDARDEEESLKARLDRDIEKPKQLYTTIEASSVSVDSTEGYLKDLEILGNTIQDDENLADIRSVGDKVENQELYKISLLSCGKNLLNLRGRSIKSTQGINELTYDISCGTFTFQYTTSYPSIDIDVSDMIPFLAGKFYKVSAVHENSNPELKTTQYLYGVYPSGEKYYSTNSPISPVPRELTQLSIRIVSNNSSTSVSGVNKISHVQLEEGSEATEYEPYQEHKLTILSPKPLKSCNSARDRIVCKNNVWVHEENVTYDAEGKGTILSTPIDTPLPHGQEIKLRTFANKTNIHFECEIEPTLKASVPKSLGASVSSNTEQIDILYRELDKIKKLLLQSEVVF